MQPNDPVLEMKKKTERYWYEDGIWEIGYGLANVLLGGFFLLSNSLSVEGLWNILWLFVQLGVVIGVIFFVSYFVRMLKERITYPRTGYIAYAKPPVSRRVKRIVFTALFSAGIAFVIGIFNTYQKTGNHMALITATIFSGALVYLGYRFTLVRFYVIAAFTLLFGYGMSLLDLNLDLSMAVVFIGFGVLVLCSGLVALINYLRRTHPVDLEDIDLPTTPDSAAEKQEEE